MSGLLAQVWSWGGVRPQERVASWDPSSGSPWALVENLTTFPTFISHFTLVIFLLA